MNICERGGGGKENSRVACNLIEKSFMEQKNF